MNEEEVLPASETLPQREQVMLRLAILVRMRPGEILVLQRRHISPDGRSIEIDYRGYMRA